MSADGIPVRLSHLLRHCGVGAIVRGADNLAVVRDTSHWRTERAKQIRYVDRVRQALEIDQELRLPPTAQIDSFGNVRPGGTTVPAVRFPAWARCLKCGLLHYRPWRRRVESSLRSRSESVWTNRCRGKRSSNANVPCNGRLEQVSWVLVHENGYLADVPWHQIAHPRNQARSCRSDEPYLQLRQQNHGDNEVFCNKCRRHDQIPLRFPFPKHTWQQPLWRESPPVTSPEPAWVLPVNDVRVHSSITGSALVIPPESRIRRGTVTDRLYGSQLYRDIAEARPGLARKRAVGRAANELRCTRQEVDEALRKIKRGYPLFGDPVPDGDLYADEYAALNSEIPQLSDREDFVTRHLSAQWHALRDGEPAALARITAVVDQLVAVERLREIMVFKGFQRLGGGRDRHVVPPDLTDESDWLPALELFGEGVFFTLAEGSLVAWERDEEVVKQALQLREWLSSAPRPFREERPSPRFLLLHTLAHLVIRQLETTVGYPTASLQERIYAREPGCDDTEPMAGILIYIAVPDTAGSLGGLVEQAEPHRFRRVLSSAVEKSTWCSLDPVCSERTGHGLGPPNGAACHGCVFVPEPTCQFGNALLDRGFVTGNRSLGLRGFFETSRPTVVANPQSITTQSTGSKSS